MSGDWFNLTVFDDGPVDVALFGLPFDAAVFFRRGAAAGPARVRELSSKLPPVGEDGTQFDHLRVRDLGDVMPHAQEANLVGPPGFFDRVKRKWLAARRQGIPLAIGGDHSVSIPLFAAADEAAGTDFGLVWIDAHPDLCDLYHGSPNSHACVLRRAMEGAHLRPQDIVMIGIRSFEKEEIQLIRELRLSMITARDMATCQASEVGAEIVRRFGNRPVYLSLDIDAFDPAFAPGTGIPDAGGLPARAVLDLLHALAPLNLLGVDLVEVAPALDVPSDITSLLALKVILTILQNLAIR